MPEGCPISDCDCATFGVSSELQDCSGPTGATGAEGETGAPGNQTIFGGLTDPNGSVNGNRGDLYKSVIADGGDGSIWVNTDGGTTWE